MTDRNASAARRRKRKPKADGASRVHRGSESKAGAKGKSRKTRRAEVVPTRADAQRAPRLIDERIRELGGWRGKALARVRALIHQADPEIVEEWKWDVPVWSHEGIVCTGEAYTKVVKLTFLRGAALADPSRLFNSSLGGNTRRAIDVHEGEEIDAVAFQALVKDAVRRNGVKTGRA
jgi:hypothetical protein